MTEFESADLPRFRSWREGFGAPLTSRDYLSAHVDATSAILLGELFFPAMAVVRDCVLLEGQYTPASFAQWWEHTGGDATEIERAVNHLHLWDVFESRNSAEEAGLMVLGQRIAACWRLQAESLFPERAFDVEVKEEYGPTVILTTRRDLPDPT